MSSENQLFSEIYTKNQLFCEFSQNKMCGTSYKYIVVFLAVTLVKLR